MNNRKRFTLSALFECIVIIALLSLFAFQSMAQTVNVTNAVPGYTVATTNPPKFTLVGLFNGSSGVQHLLGDAVSYIEQTPTTNSILQVEGGVLYAESTHKIGGFLDFYLPIGGTNSILGAGFGVAYLDQNFYDSTLNARLGDTFNIPFLRIPIYAYIESGGGYNLSKMQIMSQAFAGGLITLPITQSITITLGGAIGTISDYSGNILAGGGSFTYHF